MRTLFFLGALAVVGLVVTGAIKMQKSNNGKVTIEIDKERVADDADRLLDEGRELLREADAALHDGAQR
jgi:hypothetical protein